MREGREGRKRVLAALIRLCSNDREARTKADPIRVILFFSSCFMRQEKEEPANEVSLCAELGHFRYLD